MGFEVYGEDSKIVSGMFVACYIELCFFGKVCKVAVLILVTFDVLQCGRYRDVLDCLVDFVGAVIVIGNCLCRVWNKVCLHLSDLLHKNVIVTIAGDWCRLRGKISSVAMI